MASNPKLWRLSSLPLYIFKTMPNSIIKIYPYRYNKTWVFDDEKLGLMKEPFVSGADDIIDKMASTIKDAEKGFLLVFSSMPFPSYHVKFEWQREEDGGNWYYAKSLDMEGWLCPALFKYFEVAPKFLYAEFTSKTS